MCKQRENSAQDDSLARPGRRNVLKAGAALFVAPLMAGLGADAQAVATQAPEVSSPGPYPARAWGAPSATAPLAPMAIQRHALGSHDVLIDVLYCGICHSDIHQARDEWTAFPTLYPCVPGHEIVGRVMAVGSQVTKFKVGDVTGVGCMVDAWGINHEIHPSWPDRPSGQPAGARDDELWVRHRRGGQL